MPLPRLACGMLLLLLPAFSFAQPVSTTDRAVIAGHIIDSVGCSIPGATVKLRSPLPPGGGQVLQQTRSDLQGHFAFEPAPLGNYWVSCEYDLPNGSGSAGDRVVLTPDGASIGFQLRPPSSLDIVDLDVFVTDNDDKPVSGARVAWERRFGDLDYACPAGTLTTDSTGHAREPAVPPGLYRITAEADGFAQSRVEERHGWLHGSVRVRLLTFEESEKRQKRRRIVHCDFPAAPANLSDLVAAVDTILVGRIQRTAVEPAHLSEGAVPDVRTRYDIQPIEIVKSSPHLPRSGAVSVLHGAGEVEWQGELVSGCESDALTQGETYLFFLKWGDASAVFWPAYGSQLLAKVTDGIVTPVRSSDVGSVIAERKGTPAEKFVREIRAAVK